jgi:hypothetical protein
MTILFAYITDTQATVASDGNIVRNSDDTIINDKTDKTFSLYDGKIVGAFSINMGIDHKRYGANVSIGTIIEEITKGTQNPDNLGFFVNTLITLYEKLLNSPDTTEPSITERTSNILLAGSRDLNNEDFEIHWVHFGFNKEKQIIRKKNVYYVSGNGAWYVAPPKEEEPQIWTAIQCFFNHIPPNLTPSQLARKAIEIGIKNSTIMKANGKFLGGETFVKTTSY